MTLNKLTELRWQEKASLVATTGVLVFILVATSLTSPTLAPVVPVDAFETPNTITYNTSTIDEQQNARRGATQPRIPRVTAGPTRVRVTSSKPAAQTPSTKPAVPTPRTLQDDQEVAAPQIATAQAQPTHNHKTTIQEVSKQDQKELRKQRKAEQKRQKQLRKERIELRRQQNRMRKEQRELRRQANRARIQQNKNHR